MKTTHRMNNLPLVALLMGVCAVCAWSQTPASISLDFKTKEITDLSNLNKLEEGKTYQLVITNINLNLYKVSIVGKDSVLDHKLEFPGFGSFSLDPITKLVGNLTSLTTYSVPVSGKIRTQLQPEYAALVAAKTIEARQGERELTLQQAKEQLLTEACKESINTEQAKLRDLNSDLYQISTTVDSANLVVRKYILAGQVEYEGAPGYQALGGSGFAFDAFIKKIDAIRLELSDMRQSVAKFQSSYISKIDKYREILSKNDTLKKADQDVRVFYDQLAKTVTEALESISASKVAEVIGGVIVVDNNKAREYRSLPIQYYRGQGSLKVNITPRDEKYGLQSYATDIRFPWSPRSFVGVGSAFYISTLYDEAFSTLGVVTRDSVTKKDSVTSYKVKQESPGRAELGIHAMITAGFCGSSLGYWQVSFGPGVSVTNKVRPRFLLGGGYAFGKRNLLTVNIGVIVGSVDRRSASVDLDSPMKQKPDQLTVSRPSCGAFLTLGYVFNL